MTTKYWRSHLAQVQDFKVAVWYICCLQLPLHTDEALAADVDGEATQIASESICNFVDRLDFFQFWSPFCRQAAKLALQETLRKPK
ncbi:MAG: hypothetical protein LBP92_10380 [Deltaproteobacteria bacterium]|jgi:hypothetical protein|nr:hypothetical protein [Deltaproteobacteria bacterium]